MAEELKKDIKDPEQAELEYKICTEINAMPEGVRDRFKALKVLQDEVNDIGDEQERE